jgi:PAS domain S-box-containing protein
MLPAAPREERILILAPSETDAETISAAATEAGIAAEVLPDMASLCAAVGEGAGAIALVEAELPAAEVELLREALRAQPTWSSLPVLLISADVERDEARRRLHGLVQGLQPGDAHLVERPMEKWILATRLAAALRARRRQYATRALFERMDVERRRELGVLSAIPVGILVLDASGRLVETNAAFHRIWGALPVRQGGEDFRMFKARLVGAGPEARPFEWRLSRVLATGQPAIEELLEIQAFDGVRRTILSSVFPLLGAEGEITGAVAVQLDVTDRARAQRARDILAEATTGLFESLDTAGTLRTLCQIVVTRLADCCAIDELDERGELCRLVAETSGGSSADEAARLLAYAPLASGNSLAARVLRSGRPILVSEVPGDWLATGLKADEQRAAFAKIGVYSVMVLPLVARGHPLGVLGIVSTRADRRYDARDLVLAEEISRRAAIAMDNARLHRQAEAALRVRNEALAELEAFLSASPVGFVLMDRDLRLRKVNSAYARLREADADEILGRTFEDAVSPEIAAQAGPLLRRVLQNGQPIDDQAIVAEVPPGSGKVRHFIESFIPVLDVDGTPRAVGVLITEVTSLKEVEGALREEAHFRERFIGVLAHDLRNPLHAIVLCAGALQREGGMPETAMRNLGRIAHAAERMERMVSNLLDLVRSRECGGIGLTRKSADLADVVRDVVGELEASHPGRKIGVSVEGDTHGEIDPDRMAEVVSNLGANALAYSPAGSTVQVDVRGVDGELALAVHNDGAPIAPDTLKRIFLPFKRTSSRGGESPAMRGLGLGLFIVGEIARAHGGTITVSSEAAEGTTFTVRLPRTCPATGPTSLSSPAFGA